MQHVAKFYTVFLIFPLSLSQILMPLQFSCLSLFQNIICTTVHWDAGSPLALCGQRVASLRRPAAAHRFPKLKKSLKSPHSQPGRSASRRGHRAAEFLLKLYLSFVIRLPLPLFLSFSYHLSLAFFCLPLFIFPPFLVFILYSVSRLDFLIHEGFRFALLSLL